MKIIQNKDISTLLNQAGQYLNDELNKTKNSSVLFLTSGGSAFSLLKEIEEEVLGPNITVGVLDERYSHDSTVNSFAQLMNTSFYTSAKRKNCEFIDTRLKENETIKALAIRFGNSLKTWKDQNPAGKVVITQGMGPDGHTSGIFPHPENPDLFRKLFENPNKWTVGYDLGQKNQYPFRVTTTISFLTNIVDISIAYVTGLNKQEPLVKALRNNTKVNEVPFAIVKKMKDVSLFTDIPLT